MASTPKRLARLSAWARQEIAFLKDIHARSCRGQEYLAAQLAKQRDAHGDLLLAMRRIADGQEPDPRLAARRAVEGCMPGTYDALDL